MRPLRRPVDVSGIEIEPLDDLAGADALVAKRIDELHLPTWPVDPVDTFVTVHEDGTGAPRILFVMNPTANDAIARFSLPGVGALVDALDGRRVVRSAGALEVTVPGRVVRMMIAEAP
jgi:beta-galactosidase